MGNTNNLSRNLAQDNTSSNSFFDTIKIIFNYACDIGFVILPSVGYIHQYIKIFLLKKSEGFSKLISFILIMSFIVRIFFWIGEKFEITILYNAIFGILVQLFLLRICLKYDTNIRNKEKNNFKRFFNIKQFWNWPYFFDYLFFLIFISCFISLISFIIGYDNKTYIFILGVLTSLIESFLDVPQIYELYKTKNPYTISYLLILGWILGDLFKVIYFFFRDTPIQLILCAIFQLTTDFILISQIFYYRKINKKNKEKNDNELDFEKDVKIEEIFSKETDLSTEIVNDADTN